MADLYPYPRFSLAERDRRWKAVRELMRQQQLDVIVTPQNSGHSIRRTIKPARVTSPTSAEAEMPMSRRSFRWRVK